MNHDDWLYDGTAPLDRGDARIVDLLSDLRHSGPRPRRRPGGAVALVLAAGAVGWWWVAPAPTGWTFQGAGCDTDCILAVGEWLETGPQTASLQVADIGTMAVAPGSRLQLTRSDTEGHRLKLATGQIHASVVAPPRLLMVDTPAATAVDLGCEYELFVADDGGAYLQVLLGYVSLEGPSGTVFVPAGAEATAHPDHGIGVPRFSDADARWQSHLGEVQAGDAETLPELLRTTVRPRDTLSLFHLIPILPDEGDRQAVVERIGALVPGSVADRRGVVARRDPALQRLRSTLAPHW